MFYRNSLIVVTLMFACVEVSAQERDPFSPTSGSGVVSKMRELVTGDQAQQQNINNFNAADPLSSTQLSGYKVTGIIISDTQKIAAIKAMNGVSYMVKVGDSLGSEGGKVSNIALDHVMIQTESQEIKLPVSNKVEVPANAAKTQ